MQVIELGVLGATSQAECTYAKDIREHEPSAISKYINSMRHFSIEIFDKNGMVKLAVINQREHTKQNRKHQGIDKND